MAARVWTEYEDELLLKGFKEFGKDYVKITETYFPKGSPFERYYFAIAHRLNTKRLISLKDVEDFSKKYASEKNSDRSKNRDESFRKVLDRDNYACRLCASSSNLEVHHIIPFSRERTNVPSNLITLCHSCHKIIEGRVPNKEHLHLIQKYMAIIKDECANPPHLTLNKKNDRYAIVQDLKSYYKISWKDLECLRIIYNASNTTDDGIAAGDICKQSKSIKNHSVTVNVDRLLYNGFILREPRQKKRKDGVMIHHKFVYFITRKGLDFLIEARTQILERFNKEFAEAIPMVSEHKIYAK